MSTEIKRKNKLNKMDGMSNECGKKMKVESKIEKKNNTN